MEQKWLRFMERHFILSGNANLRRQLPHSYLTAAFSHVSWDHLASNLACLLNFGVGVERVLGVRKYVYLYMTSIFFSKYVAIGLGEDDRIRGSLGASGALSAVQAYYCLRFPKAKFKFGEYALRAPWACLTWFLLDVLHLGENKGIGHGTHLGGYIFGTLFYLTNDIMAPCLARDLKKTFLWHFFLLIQSMRMNSET